MGRMNPIGIMSYVYLGYPARRLAEAVASHGISVLQLDPRQKGLCEADGLPDAAQAAALRRLFAGFDISIPVLSGYTNLVHPDREERERRLRKLEDLIRLGPEFGAKYVATETGSLHPKNQWAAHPDNRTEAAWAMLTESVGRLRETAVRNGVTLLLEGFVNNVFYDPVQADRIVAELGTSGIGFVMDPFNFMTEADLDRQEQALDRIFDCLADRAPVAHAKDVIYTEKGIETPRAGTGRMRWRLFAERLSARMPDVPLVLEHLKPEETGACLEFVRRAFEREESATHDG